MFRLTASLCRRATLKSLRVAAYCTDDFKPVALRSKKPKALGSESESFVDCRHVNVAAGRGGDGTVSFLQLWANETAGPDGGDGGNGGHVIFQAAENMKDLKGFDTVIRAENGEKGGNKDLTGRSAKHTIVKVPIGTILKDEKGTIVADLYKEGLMYLAARGGAGGHGNHFFINDTHQTPDVAEIGADGETFRYILEVTVMAHFGLVGSPNAGKSTLLRAISRAKPKVAPYAFTTMRPHIGIVPYSDYEQIAVADLPGLIEGSHKNRGLGVQFLKHLERCLGLVYVIDLSLDEPWEEYEMLQNELDQYNPKLRGRMKLVIANKIDLPEAQDNLEEFKKRIQIPVITVSAKEGTNLTYLLEELRKLYDEAQIVKSQNKTI